MNPLCMFAAGMWFMLGVDWYHDGRRGLAFTSAAVSAAFVALAAL